MADKRKGALVVGGIGLASLLLYMATRKVEAAPGLANLYISVIDEYGVGLPDALLTIDSLPAYTDINGNCALLEIDTGSYSGTCSLYGYEITSVALNGVEISFAEGGIIMDFELTQGVSQLVVVMKEEEGILAGRIGQWGYSTTCVYPTAHVESGLWPDHALDFDYNLRPSTWYIDVVGYNDSPNPVTAKLEIVGTNANIFNQAGDQYIQPGGHAIFNFSMGLPRVRGEYHFDAVLSFDGVTVAEGRWTINYDGGVSLASIDIQVNDEAGNPLEDVLFKVNTSAALTDHSGACAFDNLELGSHQGYCHKTDYKVTSIKLNGVEIPVTPEGYF
jgi:hypothetical protein